MKAYNIKRVPQDYAFNIARRSHHLKSKKNIEREEDRGERSSVVDPKLFIPDPDPALNFPSSGSGSRQKFRIHADPDPDPTCIN